MDHYGLCNQVNVIDSHSNSHAAQEMIDIKAVAAKSKAASCF